ncbi:alpha/beta hydrolase family protein [Phenylobacterium montanum]|uniref:S9 family peptidase n=1 Tax=Phenylobacterium montanum TaxID=2823693 RepID=A0A975G1E1_9CAUL|nr:S9 family peptidase [Caulobacter sp. S6]QUD89110.1 S9 family peptidase [Caulobacter sp. S6]
MAGTAFGAALAASPEAPARTFQPLDLFQLQAVRDPEIAPDGRQVAYVRDAYDIMTDKAGHSIWLVDAASGAQVPLGGGGVAQTTPRWSPDGKRLAYVQVSDKGAAELYVRWVGAGASARIASLPQAPRTLAWSPDGRQIAFVMFTPGDPPSIGQAPPKPDGAHWAEPLQVIDTVQFRADDQGYLKPGHPQLYVVAADGGAIRQLTFGAFDDDAPISWTPDGRSLLFSANRGANWQREPLEANVYSVSVADGALTQLSHGFGPYGEPQASPDGKLVAFTGFEDKHVGYQNIELFVMDRDGKAAHSLTKSLDRSVDSPRWAADGKSVFVHYIDQGVGKVGRVGLDGHFETVAAGMNGGELDRPYSGGEYSVSQTGMVAFTQGAPDEPGDLALAHGGKTERLTRLNDGLFAGKALAKVEPLAVTSSFDKRSVGAWIVTPPDFDRAKKYPLILEIHGGPFASYGPVFGSEAQLLAAAGYVVVYANPRGSTSYGFDYADQINYTYPNHDYDDLMSVVDAAIAKGSVDPNNLFVMGGSGGGLLTAWIVGKTDRFRAAVSEKPVINWTSEVLTTDGAVSQAAYWFSKMPWEDQDQYWRRSPLSLVGAVKTPTMVMVGTEDMRTPHSEAEQFYEALKIRDVPTMMVRVPGASHESLAERPSQQAAEISAILAWFEKYRRPAGS